MMADQSNHIQLTCATKTTCTLQSRSASHSQSNHIYFTLTVKSHHTGQKCSSSLNRGEQGGGGVEVVCANYDYYL